MLFTLTAVSTVGYVRVAAVGILLLIAALLVMLWLLAVKQKRGKQLINLPITALILCGLVTLLFSYHQYRSAIAVEGLDGTTAYIEGTVIDMPESATSDRYVVKVDSNRSYTLLLNSKNELGGSLYDRVSGYVYFYGGANVNYGTDIWASPDTGVVQFQPSKSIGLTSILRSIRGYTLSCVDRYMDGDAAALAKGIILGDVSSMTDQTRRAFNTVGLSHIIVVSGLHLSIVVGFIMQLLPFGMKRRRYFAAVLIPILMYMAFTGFGVSIVRAGVCTVLYIICRMILRDSETVNCLGLSAIFMCVLWPEAAISLSFQLSFFATAGIVLIYPPVRLWLKKKKFNAPVQRMIELMIVTLSAQLMVWPLMTVRFGTVPLLSVITNMMLTWVANIIIIGGFIMVLSSTFVLFLPINYLASFICNGVSSFCVWIVTLISKIPYATLTVARSELLLCISFLALLGIGLAVTNKTKLRRTFALLICVVLVAAAVLCVMNVGRMTVMTVSKDCTVITYRDTTVVLGGCDNSDLRKTLDSAGIESVELLDVHGCEDETVLNTVGQCQPKRVIVPSHSPPSTDDGIAVFSERGVETTLDGGMTVSVSDRYAVIKAGGMSLAIAEASVDLTEDGRFDFILCRGKTIANAEVWIMHPGAKALAIDSKRVYNIKEDSCSFKLDRHFGLVLQ